MEWAMPLPSHQWDHGLSIARIRFCKELRAWDLSIIHILYLGLPYADSQWEVPANAKPKEKEWAEKGYSWQTRLWIDDMYMITIVQTHAYKVTKDRKYIDRAAKEMVMYLDELQRPNGLFYHAPDVPFYWGRGNGWMAAGMSELLRCLPKKHKDRARILEGYQKMMKSLKAVSYTHLDVYKRQISQIRVRKYLYQIIRLNNGCQPLFPVQS